MKATQLLLYMATVAALATVAAARRPVYDDRVSIKIPAESYMDVERVLARRGIFRDAYPVQHRRTPRKVTESYAVGTYGDEGAEEHYDEEEQLVEPEEEGGEWVEEEPEETYAAQQWERQGARGRPVRGTQRLARYAADIATVPQPKAWSSIVTGAARAVTARFSSAILQNVLSRVPLAGTWFREERLGEVISDTIMRNVRSHDRSLVPEFMRDSLYRVVFDFTKQFLRRFKEFVAEQPAETAAETSSYYGRHRPAVRESGLQGVLDEKLQSLFSRLGDKVLETALSKINF